jgi:NADPH:quinone reductase-like Zn-dependent oxidoreductase
MRWRVPVEAPFSAGREAAGAVIDAGSGVRQVASQPRPRSAVTSQCDPAKNATHLVWDGKGLNMRQR